MPRHVFNLLGVVNDIEHVLRGEGDNASADVLARYVRGHLDVLDVPSRDDLAQVAQQLDELRTDIAALASWMDADMVDDDDEADQVRGDDGSTDDAVPTTRRPAVQPQRGGAGANGVACGYAPAFKDAEGNERTGGAVARRGTVVPAAARGGSGARRAGVKRVTRGTRKK